MRCKYVKVLMINVFPPGVRIISFGVPRQILEYIIVLKYCKKIQISHQISRKFLLGNWQHYCDLTAPGTALLLFSFILFRTPVDTKICFRKTLC